MTDAAPSVPAVIAYLRQLHDRITSVLEAVDGGADNLVEVAVDDIRIRRQ